MNFEEILDRDSKFESLLGEVGEKESPFEKVLGEIKPVEASLTDLKSAPKIDLQSKKFPESFLGRQMKGMEASLGLSKEEFDILETEIISQEDRDSFVESVEEVTALAGQPYDIAKGASAFIMAGIPTFLLGVGGAVSEMDKELPQLFAGYSNLLDMADAAERGFNKVAEYMQPGKEKVEKFLEFPRETFKGAFGEPLSELLLGKPVDSDLVGEIAMVPMTVAEKPFAMAAESEKVKTFAKVAKMLWLDKVFITEDNIRGALKFAGFFAGLAALHKVYRGKPGVVKEPLKRSVIKDVKEVAEKAEKIAETEMLVEKTPDAAIKSAQEKILKMEKQQLELEAKKIAEDLKKEVDVEKVIKEELKKKGRKVEEIKSGLRTAEERQVEIDRAFKEEVEVAVEKKVVPEEGVEISKELTPDLAEKVKYEGVQKKLVKLPTGERTEVPAFHQFRDKKTGSSFIIPFEEDINAGVLKKLQRLEGKAKKVEPEPITEVDRQTGVSVPEIEGEKSPFFQTKEKSEVMAKVYEGRKISSVEVLTQKLVNDVNRAYHGDKSVDIAKVRDELSEITTRANELNMAFDNPVDFREWKATVEEAAIWARRSEPLIGTIETHKQIPIDIKNPLTDEPLSSLRIRSYPTNVEQIVSAKTSYVAISKKAKIEGDRIIPPGKVRIGKETLRTRLQPYWIEGKTKSGKWEEIWRYNDLKEAELAFEDMSKGIKPLRLIKKQREGVELYSGIPAHKLIKISKQFKSWFGKSKIKETVFHGTPSKFTEFDPTKKYGGIGFHFGTREQARARMKETVKQAIEFEGEAKAALLEGYLRIEKPLHMIDPLGWDVEAFTDAMIKQKLPISKRTKDRIIDLNKDYQEGEIHVYKANSKLEEILKDGGYDGIIYENKVEGLGDSYVVFDSSQFKSVKNVGTFRRDTGQFLYSGLPLDKAGKLILEGAKRAKEYMDDARRAKRIRPVRAAKIGYEAAIRELVDKSGNIKWDFIDKLGLKGYEIVQKLVLTKGANTIAANKLKQMSREIYGGLTRSEKHTLDNLIMYERLLDIAKYKTVKEFNWPILKRTDKQLTPADAISYIETFSQLEGITPERASIIRRRAKGYFEWMKRPLDDLLKAELISQAEYDDLVSHKYRRIKLIDIFDKKYESKRGRKPLTVYDSGIQELARGRKTDIYEPSSEIMALEVFNRSYGRIMRQKANKALFELAKSDPKNPFVRMKDGKGGIPSGWQRIFVFDKGERKALYISEQMSKEWLTSSSELPMAYGRALQWFSGSAVLRTFATGISWGFALRNIPRDIMHIYYAARVWEDGKWKSAYSPHLPIFLPQIGMDIARVLPDVIVRGKKTQNYFDYGGGMEFLVHQGLMLRKGKHLEPGLAKPLKILSWFGETSELTTRVAIKEHIIRRRARKQGLTVEEARKNKDIQREASFVARDYLDFGQGGGMVKGANNAFPYLNARVQASRGIWRTAKDNKKEFLYKVFEMGAATTLLYSAMREQAPETTKALQGSMDLQNNLCIPVGDNFGFEDEKGQMRYWGFKVPLDGGQRFFKAFFEAAYDKSMGHEVDVDRVIGALKEMSPVDISAFPPTASGAIGYLWNEDLWRGKDVWRETKKPFKYELPEWAGGPEVGGSKEEYIPGETSEFMTDVGKYTGISPERGQFVAEELVTSNSEWFYLLGKGYEKLFADVPKEKVEQQWAEVLMRERENQRLGKIVTGLKEAPIIGSFIFVTNPYSKYAGKIEEEEGRFAMTRFVENRELDRLTDGYLFEGVYKKEDVVKYYKSFKDLDTRERLRKRFDFQVAIRKLPERSFWLRLRSLAPEIRASRYYDRLQSATPEEHERLMREKSIVTKAGGFFTENFWLELRKIRREKE